MKGILRAALAAAVWASTAAPALAADVSLTGSLAFDNDVQLFSFTLAGAADVTLRTWSYAGGVNAAGNAVAAGGFDAVLALFSGSGDAAVLIGGNDDGLGVATDPGTGEARDALLEVLALPAGTYTVALSQFANFANGPALGDGFFGAGETDFGGRTSAWALDILNVGAANAIPEAATRMLAVLGLVALAWPWRRRRAAAA